MNDPIALYSNAIDALNQGDWHGAQQLAERLTGYAPRHGGVHYIAGVAALQLHQMRRAIGHLQLAIQYGPERADYRAQYARSLAMMHRLGEAVAAADVAMELVSSDALTYDTLGVVYSRAQAHRQAAKAFERAVELMPDHANYRFNLATSFFFYGDIDAAEREYEECVRIDPGYWRAHLSLSQLRKQTLARNHVARAEELLQKNLENADATLYLHLSLAKEFEDFGEYPKAFSHYVDGKAAYREKAGYSARRNTTDFDAIRRYFDVMPQGSPGHGSREPIFVLGMPRSGTTLTDRILTAHSNVYSAGELSSFGIALARIDGKPLRSFPEMNANPGAVPLDWQRLGKEYIESTRPGTGHSQHFVDKLPHNFLYAGFIANALPNAKIICLRRNPMDTCLSNFRQMFAPELPNYSYSYDILDTGRYYLEFDALMKYWQRLLPGRIMEIEYERLVDAQEETTRALLDFCGLQWEDACMRFEENVAPVPTASAAQVRSGMNRAFLQRWKRYEPQLDDLRRLLESGGIQID